MIVVYQMKGIDVGKLIQAFKSNFKYSGRRGRPPYQIMNAPRGENSGFHNLNINICVAYQMKGICEEKLNQECNSSFNYFGR